MPDSDDDSKRKYVVGAIILGVLVGATILYLMRKKAVAGPSPAPVAPPVPASAPAAPAPAPAAPAAPAT